MKPDLAAEDRHSVTLTYVLLHDKYPVLIELVECVRLQLAGTCWLLLHGKRHTAKDLMGPPFWGLLTRYECRQVGSVIAHLVATGELPLSKAEKRSRCEPKLQTRSGPGTRITPSCGWGIALTGTGQKSLCFFNG